jgi:hypothetical protein
MKKSLFFPVLLAVALGIAIAWIDSRPNWDDAGISAFLLVLSAAVCGFLASEKPWIIALAVAVWIPIYGILATQNLGSLLALLPGFFGAYVGYLIRKLMS